MPLRAPLSLLAAALLALSCRAQQPLPSPSPSTIPIRLEVEVDVAELRRALQLDRPGPEVVYAETPCDPEVVVYTETDTVTVTEVRVDTVVVEVVEYRERVDTVVVAERVEVPYVVYDTTVVEVVEYRDRVVTDTVYVYADEPPALERPGAPTPPTLDEALDEISEPVARGEMLVGVTAGLQTYETGNWPDLWADSIPLARLYYLIEHDFDTERPIEQPLPAAAPVPYDGTKPWYVYSNKHRHDNAARRGMRRPLVSTENHFRDAIGGKGVGVDDWTWKYYRPEDWGAKPEWRRERIVAWVSRQFIPNMNAAWGVGGWDWQIASESWDERWPEYAGYLLDGYLATPEALRPRVIYAAMPVGQGSAKLDDEGYRTNGYFPGSFSDFVLERWRPYIHALTFHTYPLEWDSSKWGFNWLDDTAEVLADAAEVVRWRDANMPGVEVWCTEFGCDYDGGYAERWYAEVIAGFEELGLARAYVFSYRKYNGTAGHFTHSHMESPDRRSTLEAYRKYVHKTPALD